MARIDRVSTGGQIRRSQFAAARLWASITAIAALTGSAAVAAQTPRTAQPAPRPVVIGPQAAPTASPAPAPATAPAPVRVPAPLPVLLPAPVSAPTVGSGALQFSRATRSIDVTLRRSLPSYVGLSVTPQQEIRLTLANGSEFQSARAVGSTVLSQAIRDNPNVFNQALARANLVLAQAALGPRELADARSRMRDVLRLPKVVFLDLDESCGCIAVGVSDPTAETAVRSFAAQSGVPQSAVRIVRTAPVRAMASLQGTFRPSMGGAQIEFIDGGSVFACSLGLPTVSFSGGAPGFLTASHCTVGTRGAMNGTWLSQPGGAPFWGDKVGMEAIDRPMFDTTTDPACPTGRLCRFSDAAFVAYDRPEFGLTGHIVRPQRRCAGAGVICDLNVERVTDDIRVVLADASDPNVSPMMGEVVDKVGRTTGWTSGAVTNTCTDVDLSNDDGTDSGMTILCQTIVAAASDHGDSGSPVFEFSSTTGAAQFEGILWGGDASSAHAFFVLSPVSGIQKELGTFVFNEAGVTAPFFSNGEFYTQDTHDDIHVTVEPNAAPAGFISVVLSSGPGIVWQKQLVVVGGNPPTSTTLTVINNVKTASTSAPVSQLPGSHLEFRKLYGSHTGTDEVARIPLDAIPPGTRLTFTWLRD